MASFIAHYRKKQFQLRELEGELLALLQKGGDGAAILRAAAEVRQAQIRAEKERMAKMEPSGKNAAAIRELEGKIEELRGVAVEAAVEEYRKRAARLKGDVVVARAPRRGSW